MIFHLKDVLIQKMNFRYVVWFNHESDMYIKIIDLGKKISVLFHYRVALNFSGSLFLRIDDCLHFAGTFQMQISVHDLSHVNEMAIYNVSL